MPGVQFGASEHALPRARRLLGRFSTRFSWLSGVMSVLQKLESTSAPVVLKLKPVGSSLLSDKLAERPSWVHVPDHSGLITHAVLALTGSKRL